MCSIAVRVSGALPVLVLTVAFSFLLSDQARAQPTRSIASSARRIEEFNKQGNNAVHDEMNRDMRGRKPSAEELRKAKIVEAQIKQDLETLQTEYNNIVIKLQSGDQIPNAFAVEIAGRIHTHAERLLGNIAFPKSQDSDTAGSEVKKTVPSQRKQLLVICNHILAFFKSPLFESPNVLDVPNAIEARRSLQSIVQTSLELKNGQD